MPIDVEVQAILDRLAAAKLEDLSSLSPAAAREVSAGLARASPPGLPVAHVRNLTASGPAGDVPLRLYRPAEPPHALIENSVS
ncbi:MAG: hypothetical protein ABSG18_01595 [Steroidobacteraceae bacterium]|jgi:acetyl esterase